MWLPNSIFIRIWRRDPLQARLLARASVTVIVLPSLILASNVVLGLRGHLKAFCLFKYLTGLPCPGCGITRGLALLAHGRVRDALDANPASVLVMAVIVLPLLLLLSVQSRRLGPIAVTKALRCADSLLLMGLLLVWLSRVSGILLA
jgi:hypothetical protein